MPGFLVSILYHKYKIFIYIFLKLSASLNIRLKSFFVLICRHKDSCCQNSMKAGLVEIFYQLNINTRMNYNILALYCVQGGRKCLFLSLFLWLILTKAAMILSDVQKYPWKSL